MRKKALKKKYPNRHQIIKSLRSTNHLKEVLNARGLPVQLNIMKHLLYEKPYVDTELQDELRRFGNHAMKKIMQEEEKLKEKAEENDNK